ncbi:MAG: hypothetical protein WCH98_10045 [Verrucomicrobiota bacterium]
MMFVLRRLLLLLVIAAAVYCFWPRTASLTGFDPEKMSELQAAVWKAATDKNARTPVLALYSIYQGQYHMPPISALKMSFDTARALRLFHTSPDAADQEKALLPLQTVFVTLRSGTKAGFDSSAAARMEFMIWVLRSDRAKRAQLTTAWAESLAVLYGHSAAECLPAAKQFSIASKLADDGSWNEAQASMLEGWKVLKSLAPPEK